MTNDSNINGEPVEQEETQSGSVEAVSGRLPPQADLFVGLGLALFGAFIAFESWRMPGPESPLVRYVYEGPGFVPGLLGVVVLLFGLLILIRSIREGGLRLEDTSGQITAMFSRPEPRRLLWLLALTLLYAGALIGRVHFLAGTFIFVAAFILVFDWEFTPTPHGRIRLAVTAGVQAALTSFVVWYVFQNIFYVRLP